VSGAGCGAGSERARLMASAAAGRTAAAGGRGPGGPRSQSGAAGQRETEVRGEGVKRKTKKTTRKQKNKNRKKKGRGQRKHGFLRCMEELITASLWATEHVRNDHPLLKSPEFRKVQYCTSMVPCAGFAGGACKVLQVVRTPGESSLPILLCLFLWKNKKERKRKRMNE